MTRNERLIPDNILESFWCSTCLNYLTIGPIGVHINGGNICGRCLHPNPEPNPQEEPPLFEFIDGPSALFTDHFEDVFPLALISYATYNNSLFPCVNRFNGCKARLPFGQIRAHESSCSGVLTQCTSCLFAGNGTQMLQHFKLRHPRSFLTNDKWFKLDLRTTSSTQFLYRKNTNLFFVKAEYWPEMTQFRLVIICWNVQLGMPKIRLSFKTRSKEFRLVAHATSAVCFERHNLEVHINNRRLTEAGIVLCNFDLDFTSL